MGIRRCLASLLLLAGALLQSPGASGAETVLPEACGLLARAEVEAVLAFRVYDGMKSTDVPNGCDYLAVEGGNLGAAVEVRAGGATTFERLQTANREKRLPTTELVGVGDRAMSVTIPNEPGIAVFVLRRDMVIAVFVNGKDASKNFQIAVGLARRILNKIS